jgi:hypothetical protein
MDNDWATKMIEDELSCKNCARTCTENKTNCRDFISKARIERMERIGTTGE